MNITLDHSITVADVRRFLNELPAEYQSAPFQAMLGSMPTTLKRLVAYRSKSDPSDIGVCANPMGTHLPFDNSLEWVHTLS